jgi:hypothetical protein
MEAPGPEAFAAYVREAENQGLELENLREHVAILTERGDALAGLIDTLRQENVFLRFKIRRLDQLSRELAHQAERAIAMLAGPRGLTNV